MEWAEIDDHGLAAGALEKEILCRFSVLGVVLGDVHVSTGVEHHRDLRHHQKPGSSSCSWIPIGWLTNAGCRCPSRPRR